MIIHKRPYTPRPYQEMITNFLVDTPRCNVWAGMGMGNWERTDAYRWLAWQLGVSASKCHFGWFNAEMCEKATNICRGFK